MHEHIYDKILIGNAVELVLNHNSIICHIGDDAARLRSTLRRSRVGSAITDLFPFPSPSGKRRR